MTQTRKTVIGLFDDSDKESPHDHESALCGSATKVVSLYIVRSERMHDLLYEPRFPDDVNRLP